jgi:aromatic-L-amino-acid decarboxylase
MSDAHSKWEWPKEDIKRVGYRVVDLIAEHLITLPTRPAFRPVPQALSGQLLAEAVPTHGSNPDEILDEFVRTVEPYPFGNGHPRFFAWVNSPPVIS